MSAAEKGYQSIPFLRFSENSVIYTEVGSFQRGGCFFSKDSPDEVIDAGIDGKIAVFVLGCDWIRLAFELLVETGFVGVKECLFLGRKGRLVLEGVNELLREVGSVTESGHVGPLAGKDGVRIIVAGLRGIGLQTADFSDITVIVMVMFAALSHAAFFMSTEDFFDVRGVFDFCHIKSWYFVIRAVNPP